MHEERLSLERTADGHLTARWIGGTGIQHPFPVPNPLVKDEHRDDPGDHRWYLEESALYRGPGDAARAQDVEQRMDGWGEALYEALRPPRADHPLSRLMAHRGPRLLTLASDDPVALSLPWELLRDEQAALALRGLVVRRQLPTAQEVQAPAIALPLRILLVVARPVDAGFIDPRSSVRPMLDALDALGGQVKVDFCEPPTLAEVERRLKIAERRRAPYHIVHFDGHGVYLPDTGVGALCFEDEATRNHLVPGRHLGDLLAYHAVPVTLLEACQTADVSDRVFGSVAPALLRAGVGSVIAFSHSVLVTAARILVQRFYQELAQGASVGEALGEGRRALQANPVRGRQRDGKALQMRDWHIAQLYQAGKDPVLVPGGAEAVTGPGVAHARGREPEASFGPPPMYGFHGRAGDLLKLRRKLNAHRAVVVHGMGGMGKTSLTREAAHWWTRTHRRPAGAAFYSFERRGGPVRAATAFVRYVEGEGFQPGSDEEMLARAVSHFRTRDVLWVWDNFESTLPQFQVDEANEYPEEDRRGLQQLYRQLVDETYKPRGWLVVTSRPGDTGLAGVAEMALGGLGKADALELAQEVFARREVPVEKRGYERPAIEALLRALDRHPLSIELVCPHLKARPPAEVMAEFHELLDSFVNEGAAEERNRGLKASLAFSVRRLSDAARRVLPYLAWFDGGAFEVNIIEFIGIEETAWDAVRAELASVALVRAEDGVLVGGRPYLRFHPTLAFAARPEEVAEPEAAARFVGVYQMMAASIDRALEGEAAGAGMQVAAREDGNLRRAVRHALALGDPRAAWFIGATVQRYLESTGRVRDRARWAAWLRGRLGGAADSAEALAAEREHAWGLLTEGQAAEAVALLQGQLARLAAAEGEDAPQQRALCHLYLGRVLLHAGRPDLALAPLAEAVRGFEALGNQESLSAALGDEANALCAVGRLDEALDAAERGVEIDRALGRHRDLAAGLGSTAQILTDLHRFVEADQRYDEALTAARAAGDPGLEATCLQHQGSLADDRGDSDRAVALYRDALVRFQAADDVAGEMETCDLLGLAESQRRHFDAARAWYDRAHQLAVRRSDDRQQAATANNLGILFQLQAEALPPEATAERARLLEEAVASVDRSLRMSRKLGNEAYAARPLSQLGILHRLRGDLDAAEDHAREALAIHERLDLPDVWKNYANLEDIADARGDAKAAATWRAKKEAKLAELRARAAGPAGATPHLPQGLLTALLSLCQAAHH